MKESRQRRWQQEIQAEGAGPSIPTSSNGTNVSIQGTGRDLRADYSLKKTVRFDACRIHSVSSIKKLWMSSCCSPMRSQRHTSERKNAETGSGV